MSGLVIERATRADLEAIIRLHEEDALASHGDRWGEDTREAYVAAFRAIEASPDNVLFVARQDGRVVGTFQVTFIPNLTGRGTLRMKIESVKVAAARRSSGIGARMMEVAEQEARRRGAGLIELTSNRDREDAHRFYRRIGYEQSHIGFKKRP